MKKLSALILAVLMLMSVMAGCVKNPDPTSNPNVNVNPTTGGDPTDPTNTEPPMDIIEFEGNYTYDDWVVTLSSNWNPHTYETADQSYPISFLTTGLYNFIFNDGLNPVEGQEPYEGYVIVPEMAAAMPEDVTEAVKVSHPQFNIPEDATAGYAYVIKLNPLATWEDGTPIKAVDYVESMKRLLDPRYQNYRSADYWEQDFCIAGAENYVNQGTSKIVGLGMTVQAWLDAGNSIDDVYVNIGDFWGIYTEDGSKWAKVTDETLIRDPAVKEGEPGDWISPKEIYEGYFAPGAMYHDAYSSSYCAYEKVYEDGFSYDNVGVYETGEYEFTLVLAKPLQGFTLLYNLSGNWLVKTDLYDACLKETDGLWTSTYNTSVETTVSYGPYKMTDYQTDKSMHFVKNENWFGHHDNVHVYEDPVDGDIYRMYQTTEIHCQVVKEVATAKMMFLKGQLIAYGLQPEDYDTYRTSEWCHFSPGQATFFLLLNGHMSAIQERENAADFDKTTTDLETMTLTSFHRAMGLCYDKALYCETLSPATSPAFGLIGNAYIWDPATGAKYRDTDQAKQVLCDVYGIDVNEYGGDLDAAVAAITGYDPVQAKEWFKKAFDEAIAAGYITDTNGDGISDQTVTLTYSAGSVTEKLTKMLNYLTEKANEVTTGTPFEGKILFVASAPLGNAWADNLMAGLTDTALAGWNGSAMNPFSLTDLYCNPSRAFDGAWFDGNLVNATFTIEGEEITMTLKQWSDALNGATIEIDGKSYCFGEGSATAEVRLQILANIEREILLIYNYLPFSEDGSMALLSKKVFYIIEDYNPVMGRGGITYLRYNYSDEAWAAYVAEQPNGEIAY